MLKISDFLSSDGPFSQAWASGSHREKGVYSSYTVWLQIFVVENFRNIRNYTIIMKIMFTKIFCAVNWHFRYQARGKPGIK